MLFYWILLLGSVVFLDVCLSGDNAVVIAMAANDLTKPLRDKAIYCGMALAALLRIILAFGATTVLQWHWVGVVGGAALLWIAYRLLKDLNASSGEGGIKDVPKKKMTLGTALFTIVVADISMSLDNVLAIAALARGHYVIMALGILASIAMLTFAARWIADQMKKWPWLNWVGIVMIVYVAIDLIAGSYDSEFRLFMGIS